jgi:uncharacterized protein
VRLLAFSDLHRDMDQAARLVAMSAQADVVIGAGDFASVHEGLEETIAALASIEKPSVVVPGNNETADALRAACDGWPAAVVLHGEGVEIDDVEFFGLGAGVPVTPWDWSYDLDEADAREKLAACTEGAVLVSHSPPKGHGDRGADGTSLGSEAVLEVTRERSPRLVLCGHIHEAWGSESHIGETKVINLGPGGASIELA